MAFEPEKIDYSSVNNGSEYTEGSLVSPEDINKWFKSGAYSQKAVETFTENVDISELNGNGTPFVGIIYENINGTLFPYLKLANLKGITGDSGLSYGAVLSNVFGDSDQNGYTQRATNALVCNPNLIINGDFKINQRANSIYNQDGYTVDRWLSEGVTVKTIPNGVTIYPTTSQSNFYFSQVIEENLTNQKVTLSAKVNGTIVSKSFILTHDMGWSAWLEAIEIGNSKLTIDHSGQGEMYRVYFYVQDSLDVEYVKLEMGSVATTHSPKPYAEELANCQRYYQKLRVHDVQYASTENALYPSVAIAQPFRTKPTITISEFPSIRGNGTILGTVNNLTVNSISDNSLLLLTNPSNLGVTKGELYAITNGYISADAEIY